MDTVLRLAFSILCVLLVFWIVAAAFDRVRWWAFDAIDRWLEWREVRKNYGGKIRRIGR